MIERNEKLYRVAGLGNFFTQNSCLQIDLYGRVNVTQEPPFIDEYLFVFKIRKPVDRKQIKLANGQIKEVPVFYVYDPTTNTRKTNDTFIVLSQREVIQLKELLSHLYNLNKEIKINPTKVSKSVISSLISAHDLKQVTTQQGNFYFLSFFRPNKTVDVIVMPPNQRFATYGIQFRITPVGKEPYSFIIRDNYELLRLIETLDVATKEVLRRNLDIDFERFVNKIENYAKRTTEELATDESETVNITPEDVPLESTSLEIEENLEIEEDIPLELKEDTSLEEEPKTSLKQVFIQSGAISKDIPLETKKEEETFQRRPYRKK